MEDKYVMKKNENALWVSIIILGLATYFFNIKYVVILIFWALYMLILGNIKRISNKKYIFTVFRRCMYSIPLLFPLLVGVRPRINQGLNFIYLIIAFFCGVLMLMPRYKDISVMTCNDIIGIMPKKGKEAYISEVLLAVVAPICEEFFFRNFVFQYVSEGSIFCNISLSMFLFFLNHFGLKWNERFRNYDYAIQLIFSLISCILFICSNSLIPSIIAHLVMNSPGIIVSVKSYYINYIGKDAGID